MFKNDYTPDWPEINAATCAAAGHRCIRCGHPYVKGTHGKGEWSPCDDKCTHGAPLGVMLGLDNAVDLPELPADWTAAHALEHWHGTPATVVAKWRILTVHHFNGDKANNQWWNLLPLCQRCHLTIQARVNPDQPYMFDHSEWLKPYVAGFYAWKYLQQALTREEVAERMEALLALELRA